MHRRAGVLGCRFALICIVTLAAIVPAAASAVRPTRTAPGMTHDGLVGDMPSLPVLADGTGDSGARVACGVVQ